jgi:bifunctional ADP-heptose synthase (sugar kinase/adenylyltransferase)
VLLVTQLGDEERREDFIQHELRTNIRPVFLTKTGTPTIQKKRILEEYSETKLLELYAMNDRASNADETQALCVALDTAFKQADLTIVADYGHGMLTPSIIDYLSREAPFLTVNAQSNAGNRGFNPISKYPRVDYICLAGHEITLDARTRDLDMHSGILGLAKRIDCRDITITQGKKGTLHYDKINGFHETPALASRVRDRVGAGDAVLAVTAILRKLNAPWDIVGFIGNVAGAELVAELGNRRSLERVAFSKHIISLLK